MNYNVKAKKADGKTWTFGTIKKNKWGNLQLSMKNTPELKAHIAAAGDWLNFSLYETEDKIQEPKKPEYPVDVRGTEDLDGVPF